MGVINRGYEQGRFVDIAGGGVARMRRSQNNLAGKHSVLRELGIGTNDPEKTMHILSEQSGGALMVERIQTNANPAAVILRKSRGDLDAKVVIADDDNLGDLLVEGYVGANNGYQTLGDFRFEVDGSVTDAAFGAPVRMVLKLASGSGLVERLRLDSSGNMGIGMNDPSTKLTVEGAVTLKEQSSADSDVAAYGQVWVKTATPNELYFTTDAGNDIQITSGTSLAAGGMTSFQLEDGDGTEVAISNAKEVKFVEGTGIDINWTDTDNGTDGDPYDLTFAVDLEGTELKSTGETGASKFLREDGDGTCSWQTVSGSGGMSSFFLEDGDGTEVEIGDAKEVKFIEGGGIDINWTDTSTGSDADPYDLTFTVADTTVAGDSGSTAITPGDTLTIAGGTNVTTAMSGDTLTITSTDTNTMGSGFVLEDGDGTEVTITENKEVKFIEGGGIDIDWTDTDNGTDADPYDLTFTVSDTTVAGDSGSTGITPGDTLTIAGGTNVTTAMSGDTLTITSTDTNTQLSTEQVQDIVGAMFSSNTETRISATYQDGDGTIDLVVDDMTANTMGSGFVLEDGDGTEVTITENKEVKIVEGTGIDVDWTDTDNGTDGDPYDLTISCDLEGTELKSTGETGGSKFLREDGDGTCSWQTVSGGGVSLSGSTNNTVATVTGADALIGEANLTFDGNSLLCVTGSASAVPCTIKGASSQSVDLVQCQDNSGDNLLMIDQGGSIRLGLGGDREIHVEPESGTNRAGKDIFIKGGKSTGNGEGGDIRFYTSPVGSSGSSVNGWAEVLKIRHDKILDFKLAAETDSGTDYQYASKVLEVKVAGSQYFLPLYEETGGGGMGGGGGP